MSMRATFCAPILLFLTLIVSAEMFGLQSGQQSRQSIAGLPALPGATSLGPQGSLKSDNRHGPDRVDRSYKSYRSYKSQSPNAQRPTPNAQRPLPPYPPPYADTSRLVRAWDIHAYDRPGENTYSRPREVGERMILSTNVSRADDIPALVTSGFTLFQTDSDHLSTEETAPGVWNFAKPLADLRSAGQ